MDHAPFIWSAYVASGLILLWTAISPLLRQKRAQRAIHLQDPGKEANDSQS